MPEVSIIMPVYNKEIYLKDSLASVLNQTFSDFELIVINDGSTDNSLDIVRETAEKDSRIRVYSQENKGVSSARNLGLEKALGNWIQFLDADDIIMPTYIDNCLQTKTIEQYDIVFSDFMKNNTLNSEVQRISIGKKEEKRNSKDLLSDFMENQFCNGYYGFLSNKLINATLIKKNAIFFDEDLSLAEDLQFLIQLYRKSKTVYYKDNLSYVYYIRENNYSFNRNIDYYKQLCIILDLQDWITEQNEYEKYKNDIDEKISSYAYTILFETNEKHDDILRSVNIIQNMDRIKGHINERFYHGFKKIIILCLRNNKSKTIKSLFKIRSFFREVYRKVLNYE